MYIEWNVTCNRSGKFEDSLIVFENKKFECDFLQLWMAILPLLTNAKILVMGTSERLGVNIHVDQLMDAIACNCSKLERLELR